MAMNLDIDALRRQLSTPTKIGAQEFDIIKQISALANDPQSEIVAREMVLRALEHRAEFQKTGSIVDALARSVGLFPYADANALGLRDRIAYEFHRPLQMGDDFVFHREQTQVYLHILSGDNIVLSAPTSFGKSRIIDAAIASGKFSNIAVVVPTLALIDETRRRFAMSFRDYKIITHLSQKPALKNLFVFTAERAVSYEHFPKIEFFVIDEFYKLDDLQEGPESDPSRAVALNIAFKKLWRMGAQFYMLGPSIERIPDEAKEQLRCVVHYTKFATVVTEQHQLAKESKKAKEFDSLINLCRRLTEPTLIYCSSPARACKIAKRLKSYFKTSFESCMIPPSRSKEVNAWRSLYRTNCGNRSSRCCRRSRSLRPRVGGRGCRIGRRWRGLSSC